MLVFFCGFRCTQLRLLFFWKDSCAVTVIFMFVYRARDPRQKSAGSDVSDKENKRERGREKKKRSKSVSSTSGTGSTSGR